MFFDFDYRGFKSLLLTQATHQNSCKDRQMRQTETDTQSLPGDHSEEELQYKPPDRTFLLKSGGLLPKDRFCY